MKTIANIQRVTLGLWSVVSGAMALAGIFFPQLFAHQLYGRAIPTGAVMFGERADGARLGLALVALVTAWTPRPPRALVWTLFIALFASAFGPILARLFLYVQPNDLPPFWRAIAWDGAAALILLCTQLVRARHARRLP